MVSPLSVKELRVVKNKAREFIKSRQIEKALIIYARILKLFPDDLESLLMLGDACLVRRDRERALKFYARAYEIASWREDIVRRLEIANEPIHTNENVEISEKEAALNNETESKDEQNLDAESERSQEDVFTVEAVQNEEDEKVGDHPISDIQAEEETTLSPEDENDAPLVPQQEISKPVLPSHNGHKPTELDSSHGKKDSDEEKLSRQELYKRIPIDQLRKKISDEQVNNANRLMDDILKSRSPSTLVAERLDDIDQLLPALIELNIRQTRDQGRPDLAEALEDILSDVLFNVDEFETDDEQYITKPVNINFGEAPTIIIEGINSKESPFRLSHIQSAFFHAGLKIVGWNNHEEVNKELQSADYLLLHNPHGQQRFIKMMAERAGINKPTIVDFDIDFRAIPMHHPDYLQLGMSSQDMFRSYTTVLQLADIITIASQYSQKIFGQEGINSIYLPEMWNDDNELWHKQAASRDTLNIGIMAITGQISDIAEVRRGIVRIIREFPQTRLVITGDADAYRLFDNLSEDRKIFYPEVEPDDYPFMLSQMDIVLSPYEMTKTNQHHSDRIVMEAGIKKIPWLASPINAYKQWMMGGILAENVEDWYFGLKKIILDPEARMKLGEGGYAKAQEREVKIAYKQWEQTITQILEVI